MKLLTWIVLFTLGYSCVSSISLKTKFLYRFGLAFPIGFGINSIIVFLLDVLKIPINNLILILSVDLVLSVIFILVTFFIQKPKVTDIKNAFQWKEFLPINLAWIFIVAAILFVAYVIIYKTMFWPVSSYDSVHGYDFIAKVIKQEGTFNNSIFNKDFLLSSVRSYYPPLVPLNLSLAYLAGFTNTKIVMALFFASVIIAFYALLTLKTSHLGAAFFTLLLIITPEYAAFSALSSPNPPCTYYSAFGLLSFYHWYKSDQLRWYFIGLLLIVFALWTRTETIIFAASSGLLVLIKAIQKKNLKLLLIYGFAVIMILVAWQLYLKFVLEATNPQPIIKHFIFDIDRIRRMMSQVFRVTFNTSYYGLAVYIFLGMIVLNIRNIIKEQDHLLLLGLIFITWVLYLLIYHQIDTEYLPGQVGWIRDGYRRGFFYFLPLMFYYCASNKLSIYVFKRLFSLKKNEIQ